MNKYDVLNRVPTKWTAANEIAHSPHRIKSYRTFLGILVREGRIESRPHPTQVKLSGMRPVLQFRRK